MTTLKEKYMELSRKTDKASRNEGINEETPQKDFEQLLKNGMDDKNKISVILTIKLKTGKTIQIPQTFLRIKTDEGKRT